VLETLFYSVHCDELVSLPKSALTDFIGTLSPEKMQELNRAVSVAVGLI
jgi:mRNA interferase MazF